MVLKQNNQRREEKDYQSLYHNMLPNLGPVAIMLSSQQAGQGTSERMHQVTKKVRMKARNKQSATVSAAYTEIKMGILQQRATQANIIKIMQRKVSVLGLRLGVSVRSGMRKDGFCV